MWLQMSSLNSVKPLTQPVNIDRKDYLKTKQKMVKQKPVQQMPFSVFGLKISEAMVAAFKNLLDSKIKPSLTLVTYFALTGKGYTMENTFAWLQIIILVCTVFLLKVFCNIFVLWWVKYSWIILLFKFNNFVIKRLASYEVRSQSRKILNTFSVQ